MCLYFVHQVREEKKISHNKFYDFKMHTIIYITLNVYILSRNNVKSVPLRYSTEPSTIMNITTEFQNFEGVESMTFDESTSAIIDTSSSPPINDYWMAQMGAIKDDLLRIQAVIVKDEDAELACVEGNQKSRNRYLMCAGSILNRNRILTSASCLHEAMHIRHNIRAPLAVIIAPLRTTVQMIRVAEYRIHPKHDTNPYSPDHSRHNLAILSLACRISSKNYYKIELPNQAMTHICTEENCFIAIYRKTGDTSNVMYQILAPQIPLHNRKRRRSIGHTERKFKIDDFSTEFDTNNDTSKTINKRSSDGSNGCSQTGAPVMINNTQTAIVAVSCDDRQSSGKWSYTDLYMNLNWIQSIRYNWNKSESHTTADHNVISGSNLTGANSKTCGNCIFNFYISVGCKEKGNCPKAGNNQSTKLSHVATDTNHPSNVVAFNRYGIQAQNIQSSWKRGQISSNDIPRLLRSSYKPCPNSSSSVCSTSLAEINNVQQIVPFEKIDSFKYMESENEKIENFAIDPTSISENNQPHINGVPKYNIIYHKNNRVMNLPENSSGIFRKSPQKLLKMNQNIYMPISIERNMHVRNGMQNWLRNEQTAITVAADHEI